MIDIDAMASRLNANEMFKASGRWFDGAIQLEIGSDRIWLKVFMGQVILATRTPPPFGFTFCIRGSLDDWKFALLGPKNRFREAYFTGRLKVEGNTIEFARIGKAVHALSEVLRELAQAAPNALEAA